MKPTKTMIDRFLGLKIPDDFNPDGGVSFTPSPSGVWPTGTNLFTAEQTRRMLDYVLEDPDHDDFLRDHDAAVLFERAAYHLSRIMLAYERRVRTGLTPEQIEKRPWECAEYVAAATFLRRAWKDAPAAVNGFVGFAWLIETDDPLGHTQYYCGPGEWCDNPNHAMKFTSEDAARNADHWREMQYTGNLRIAEHEWVAR